MSERNLKFLEFDKFKAEILSIVGTARKVERLGNESNNRSE